MESRASASRGGAGGTVVGLLFGLALANPLDDGPVESLTLRFDTRYDRIDRGAQANRLQNSALVSFTTDLLAGVQVAGMAVTGDDFTSRWHTWYDLDDAEPERMALALRLAQFVGRAAASGRAALTHAPRRWYCWHPPCCRQRTTWPRGKPPRRGR